MIKEMKMFHLTSSHMQSTSTKKYEHGVLYRVNIWTRAQLSCVCAEPAQIFLRFLTFDHSHKHYDNSYHEENMDETSDCVGSYDSK